MDHNSPTPLTIRLATPADAQQIAQVHMRSWQYGYRGIMPQEILDNLSLESMCVHWLRRLNDNFNPVLVCEAEGQVTGWAAFGPTHDTDKDPKQTWEVFGLYFDPDAWGKGYSAALWSGLEEFIRQQAPLEVTEFILWVLEPNQRARRFYEKMGMQIDLGAVKFWEREQARIPETRYYKKR